MPNTTTFSCCPHCGRGPGIREALDAIRATLQTVLVAQVLTGWRLLAVPTYVAGLILVDQGASLLRVGRYLPRASHDQLTRLLGERDLSALLMATLRALARALTHVLGAPVWIVVDVIVPKPASKTLAWAKGLWCPSEQRYVRAIAIVVVLANWGPLRIPLGFRLWCPKECAPPQLYRTKLDLAVELVAEALADRVGCHYVVFDSWYTARPLTSYLEMQGLIWHGALAANHEVVWQGQRQRVDALGRKLHGWYARRLGYAVASGAIYSRGLGPVRLTRVRIGQKQRPQLYLVTNQRTCTPSQAWQCKRSRWPVEELFRDEKQLVSYPSLKGLGLSLARQPICLRDVWRTDRRPAGNVPGRDHISQPSEAA
jgi:DDE superfamily endonuclease